MDGLTTRQTKILVFLEEKNKMNQKPDMLEIMNFIVKQVKCEPIDVIRDMNLLVTRLKVIKTRTVTSVTYRTAQLIA